MATVVVAGARVVATVVVVVVDLAATVVAGALDNVGRVVVLRVVATVVATDKSPLVYRNRDTVGGRNSAQEGTNKYASNIPKYTV